MRRRPDYAEWCDLAVLILAVVTALAACGGLL
jgi:hypothetical protein